ncbi:MAG TPA: phenylalanine--tRNA ligase subunit beta [Acidisarcina sp.]
MKILSQWLRQYLPEISITDAQLAEDLTLRGIAVEGVFDLGAGNGSLFEMDITTNRVDAMNHYGIAREAGAIYGVSLAPIDSSLPAAAAAGDAARSFSVSIEEPALCGRFTARVLRQVSIWPSNGVIAERFRLLGQKPISNAVDATNYVTLAIGQPTHAFDLDKITGGLVVRRARRGERLRTLDGVERTLDPEDLIVADERQPLGIAGVMGGYDSMITPETRNIVVEAAWFDPAVVRSSARRHGLHTDASHRFERGADFNAPPLANALVSRIILEAGGEQHGAFIDVIIPKLEERTAKRAAIQLQLSEVRRMLGATEDGRGIDAATTGKVLTGLGCLLRSQGDGKYAVTLPSWRLDLEREIDLIEEVARVYGYNRFANTLPPFAGAVVELPWAAKEAVLRQSMLALGWNEAVSSTFCSASDAAIFAPQPASTVALGNPLSEEAGMLRPSLLGGMLTMLQHNLYRDVLDVQLFEMGTVFHGSTERVDESTALALGASGQAAVTGPHQLRRALDFYDIKGAVEQVMARFAGRSVYYDSICQESGSMPAWLHPGRSARAVADGVTVGFFGELHPAEAHRRKLKQTVFLGELYLERLFGFELREPTVRELSRYQPVRRDYSLVFPHRVRWVQIAGVLEGLGIAEMIEFEPREVRRDAKGVADQEHSYSMLISVVFQSIGGTLQEEELQKFSSRVIAALEAVGGRLRS